MATITCPGPLASNPGYVDGRGAHKLENAAGYLPHFVMTNSGSAVSSGAGKFLLEYKADYGAQFGVFLMDASNANKTHLGDFVSGGGATNMTINSTIQGSFVSTVGADGKTINNFQFVEMPVLAAQIQAIDGASTFRLRIQPRGGQSIKITGCEVQFPD